MDIIEEIIRSNAIWITLYALLSTVIIIIIVITLKKRKRKYIDWKKDTINLYIFKREWERNDDWLQNELFSENEILRTEISLLKKENKNLSIFFILIVLFLYIFSLLKKIKTPFNR